MAVSDNFNRGSDGDDIATGVAAWTHQTGRHDIAGSSTQVKGHTDALNAESYYNGSGVGNDQRVGIKYAASGTGAYMGPLARASGTGGSRKSYLVLYGIDVAALYKVNGATYTDMSASLTANPSTNTLIEIEVVTTGGNAVIKVYKDGVQDGSTMTDSSSPYLTGEPGFGTFQGSTLRGDDWAAAAVGGSTVTLAQIEHLPRGVERGVYH